MSETQSQGEQNRRAFLKSLAGLGLGGTVLSACGGNRVAAAAAGSPLDVPLPQRVGVQLYTVRDRLQQDFEGTIAQVAEIGFKNLEFAGYYNRTPEQVRRVLEKHGLRAPSAHIGLDQFRSDLNGVLTTAKTIGHEYVVIPSLPQSARADLAAWRSLATEFNRYGEAARQQGLKFAYHNHAFEFEGVQGGQTGYDVLLRDTDPALVSFEQDLYWSTFAGRDPVELFNRAPGRFPLWHVKDLTSAGGTRTMTPVGAGQIDFKRIFAAAEQAGLVYPFVEHDTAANHPGGSLESIRTSYQNLQRLLA